MTFPRKLLLVLLSPFVLLILIILWLAQFVVFAPFLLVSALFLRRRTSSAFETPPAFTNYRPSAFVFDRLADVSKLHGCNTRNVRYRWDVFHQAVESVKNHQPPGSPPAALDFGAGCLRDTYELAKMGFRVTACDLSSERMAEGGKAYNWKLLESTLPEMHAGDVANLPAEARFDVITAFDVIEHLHEPEKILRVLRGRLQPNGVFLITVPNSISIFELFYKRSHERNVRDRKVDMSGIPHVQFRTPRQWSAFFESQGFRILKHDMSIGFLVNNLWAGFYGVALRTGVEPVLLFLTKRFRLPYRRGGLENLFYPPWLMDLVDRWDIMLKPRLLGYWGWNLFVLSPAAASAAE